MGVTGPYAKVNKIVAELAALGTPRTFEVAGRAVGQAVLSEVQLGFRKEVAPNDTKWVPRKRNRKRNKGAGKLLRDTGRLGNSFTAQTVGDTVVVGTNVEYAPHHQFGTKGHSAAFGRKQAVSAIGRFTKAKARGKKKATGFRVLEFKEGGGKIPARPFLPLDDLPPRFERAVAETVVAVLKKTAPHLLGGA